MLVVLSDKICWSSWEVKYARVCLSHCVFILWGKQWFSFPVVVVTGDRLVPRNGLYRLKYETNHSYVIDVTKKSRFIQNLGKRSEY